MDHARTGMRLGAIGLAVLAVGCAPADPGKAARTVPGKERSAVATVLDPTGIAIATSSFEEGAPSVASDGSGWLVAWDERRNDGTRDVRATRVRTA